MAKSFIGEFLVRVTSAGLTKTKADVDSLGKTTQQLATSHTIATKAAREHFDVQAKGVIGTANSTKSFSKLAETMNSGSGVVGAYATLAANVFAVTAAFNALRSAAQVEQLTRGLDEMGNRMGLNLERAANQVREITGYTINLEQAYRSTAQVMSAGLGTEALRDLTEIATDVSVALGRNMPDSMDRLIRGVVKLEPELLDELGLMTKLGEATRAYANETGQTEGSLSSLERRQAFLNAIVAEGQLKFGGLSEAAGDTRNLDRLGATFTSLTQEIFSFINVVALPLANLLNNKGLLIAGMVLFGSTISRQLLPGLTDLAQNSARAAEHLTELAKAQAQNVASLNPASRVLKKFNESVLDGTASYGDYTRALTTAGIARNKYEAIIATGSDRGKPVSPQRIANLRTEVEVLESYQTTLRKVIATEQEASARFRMSQAITAGSQGKVLTATELLSRATLDYSNNLNNTAKSGAASNNILSASFKSLATSARITGLAITNATTVMGRIRVAAFAAAAALRVLGAAFLNAIPVIGQIILVATLLYEGIKALIDISKSSEQKAYEESLKAQREQAEQLEGVLVQLNRVSESRVAILIRERQYFEALSNSVITAIDTYAEAASARNAYFRADNVSGQKLEDSPEFAAVEILRQLPGAYEELRVEMERLGVSASILSNPDAIISIDQLNLFGQAIENTRDGVGSIGPEIIDLAQNYEELSKAIRDFNRSAVAGTPFDQIITNLVNANSGLANLAAQASDSTQVVERLGAALAGIGPELTDLLPSSTRTLINEYNELLELEQRARELPDPQMGWTAEQFALNREAYLARQSFSMENLATEVQVVFALEDQLLEIQNVLRTTSSIVQVEQARLNVLNRFTALSGSTTRARREAENRIILLQSRQIELQLELARQQVAAREEQIEFNRTLLQTNSIYQSILGNATDLSSAQSISGLMLELTRLSEVLSNSTEGSSVYNQARERQVQVLELLETAQELRGQELSVRDRLANIQALQNQLEASNLGLTSERVIAAEVAATNAETAARTAEETRRIEEARLTIAISRENLERLTVGRVRSVREEYEEIARSQNIITRATIAEARARSEATVRGLYVEQANAIVAGRSEEVRLINERIERERESLTLQLEQIEVSNRVQILERFGIDTRKEGLELQRESLNYLERSLDAQAEISRLVRENAAVERQIERRRAGIAETDDSRRLDEIDAAREAFELAVQQSSLRRATIEIEFTLLEAQRQQTLFNLEAQRTILSGISGTERQVAQLDAVMRNLVRAEDYIRQGRNASIQAIDESVLAARNAYELALLPEGNRGFAGDILRDRRALREAMARGVQDADLRIETPDLALEYAPLIVSNEDLTSSVISLTGSIDALVEETFNRARSGATTSGPLTLDSLGRMLQGEGYRVSEGPGFGGVTPGVHDGRGHAEGRALDVNIGYGNIEANNPEMAARFDGLAERLRAMGLTVIWRRSGHYNHMHVEIPAGGITGALTQVAEQAATDTESGLIAAVGIPLQRLTETVSQLLPDVLEDIVVTGTLPTTENIAKILDEETLGKLREALYILEDLNILMNSGPYSMSSVFGNMAESLGPNGTIVPTIISGLQNIEGAYRNLLNVLNDPKSDFGQRFEAYAAVAQSSLATIQSVLNAGSEARVDNIDREIAAEQQRDGKSAESVAKIQSLERKKDAIQRKSFETNKKLMMAQAIIATATGVAGALGSPPYGIPAMIMAGVIGAMGAAQLAIIAGTSYQSTSSASNAVSATASNPLSIGKRGDSVDLARNNPNAGGELGYLRGQQGYGSNASNYRLVGSAYGGPIPRGYGNAAYLVGEKGPEIISPDVPMNVRPANDNKPSSSVSATINIRALDAKDVENVLRDQRGNIIGMLREAANSSGESFMEDVDVAIYNRPSKVSRL